MVTQKKEENKKNKQKKRTKVGEKILE